MKTTPTIIGAAFIALLAVYSGQVNLGSCATFADQSGDARQAGVPTSQPRISVTPSQGSDASLVEIHVNDTSLLEVLRMLSLQSRKNIVASNNVTGNISVNLYEVTVSQALDAIIQGNGYVYREKGNCIYVCTKGELADRENADRHRMTRVFHLHFTTGENAAGLIKPALSPDAQVAASIGTPSSVVSTGTNGVAQSPGNQQVLVVTDYPDNLDNVIRILADVDCAPSSPQALHKDEDLRPGMRNGLMYSDRKQLAEMAYDYAAAELSKPNPDLNLALWHLEMVTNLDPGFPGAYELKEKISGKRFIESNRGIIQSYVSDSVLGSVIAPPMSASLEANQ